MEEVKIWRCEYCRREFRILLDGTRHEKSCERNPSLRGCITCKKFRRRSGRFEGHICREIKGAITDELNTKCPRWEPKPKPKPKTKSRKKSK